MLRKHKIKIILSAIVTLLPMVLGLILWEKLPDTMTTHWGADGQADGFSSKAFAVFGLPILFLALHMLGLLPTLLDRKQKEQNAKALGMIFWIIPTVSWLANGIMYRAALGGEMDLPLLVLLLLGAMLIYMGNYLPKTKQNSTLGIKISWTLRNEENWNRTHRFSGKVWVIGGMLLPVAAFLPLSLMPWLAMGVLVAIAGIPIVYSYCIYRQHRERGIVYTARPKSRTERIVSRVSAVLLSLILVGIAVVMLTGEIRVDCADTALRVDATYWSAIEVDYADIDTVEYRKDLDVGVRTNGFGSARLSLGIFENREFGAYTLYAYAGATEFVVLTSGEKTLVIGMSRPEDTAALYQAIFEKVGGSYPKVYGDEGTHACTSQRAY